MRLRCSLQFFLACSLVFEDLIGAQQLPVPHTIEQAKVHHKGGLGGIGHRPAALAASRDGHIFVMSDGSVWSVKDGRVVGELGKALQVFYLSSHGTWLAFADGNSVKLWTLATGEVRELAELDSPAMYLTGSPDEVVLAVATHSSHAPQLFRVASGERLRNLVWSTDHHWPLSPKDQISFSPDGTLLAFDNEIWSVGTGQSRQQLQGTFRAFTHNGASLLTIGGNGRVEEVQLSSGQKVSQFDLPVNGGTYFKISPNGRLAVTTEPLQQGVIRLWDMDTGLQVRTIRLEPLLDAYQPAFLGTSDWLIAFNRNAVPKLVLISTGEELASIDSNQTSWSVVRSSDGAYDASPEALLFTPRQSGPAMSVDGVRVDASQARRVPGLLCQLPGAPTGTK